MWLYNKSMNQTLKSGISKDELMKLEIYLNKFEKRNIRNIYQIILVLNERLKGRTFREIAKDFNLTAGRIMQIESKGLEIWKNL